MVRKEGEVEISRLLDIDMQEQRLQLQELFGIRTDSPDSKRQPAEERERKRKEKKILRLEELVMGRWAKMEIVKHGSVWAKKKHGSELNISG